MPKDRAIGIDLGTTFSCAAVVDEKKPMVIHSSLGYATIPSVVTFDDQGKSVVGQLAERRMILEPENTIYGAKRLLGRSFLKSAIEKFQPQFKYKLVGDDEGFIAAEISGRTHTFVDISSLILAEIKRSAQRILGQEISRAVITVPAFFNENQRALIRKAGKLAGLDVIRIINEPTAAALAFCATVNKEQRLLVFDLGGGTFDVSIVEVKGSVFTVVGVGGDTFLGGIDVDARLADIVAKRLSKQMRKPVELDPINAMRLRIAAQKAKHQLSVQQSTLVQIDNLMLEDGSSINVTEKVTRDELEDVTRDLCENTLKVVKDVIETANLETKDIDEVLLAGGQTRMPIIHDHLEEMFGFEPSKRVHPDEVVALGAAIAADSADRTDAPVLVDVLPVPIGVANPSGNFRQVIPMNTPVPHKATVTIGLLPGADTLKVAVFQGHNSNALSNEYLGTLVLDGIEPSNTQLDCVLEFKLDAESILQLHASIDEQGIERDLELITRFTPEKILKEMNAERIHVNASRIERPQTASAFAQRRDLPNPRSTVDVGINPKGSQKKLRYNPPIEKNRPVRQYTQPVSSTRMVSDNPSWLGRFVDWILRR